MSAGHAEAAASDLIRLWDWPVRICHWAIAIIIPLMWWTAEQDDLERHRQLGLALLFILLFRLIWGVVGSAPARFANFVRGPAAMIAHVRGERGWPPGHSPLGALSVVALFAVLLVQLGLGLMAQDEYGEVVGPLNHLVSFETAAQMTELHELLFNGLAALIGVHIAAVLYYTLVKRDNLIRPMLSGYKVMPEGTEQPRMATLGAALLVLIVCGAVVAWIAAGAPLR